MLSGAKRGVVQRGLEHGAEVYCTDPPHYSASLKTDWKYVIKFQIIN